MPFLSSISLAGILSHALATIFLGELGQGCNVHNQTWATNIPGLMVTLLYQNQLMWGGKKQLSDNNTNARHNGKIFHCNQIVLGTMDVKGRTALDSGQMGSREEKTPSWLPEYFVFGEYTQVVLFREILVLRRKKCRFMACQRLIILVILLYLLNCSYQRNKKPGNHDGNLF